MWEWLPAAFVVLAVNGAFALVITKAMSLDVTNPEEFVSKFSQWGPWGLCTSMLAIAILAVLRGWWTPGSYYAAMKTERDQARQDASDAIKTLERLTAGWKPQQ